MKLLFAIVFSLIYLNPLLSQDKSEDNTIAREISQKDSITHYLMFIDQNNKAISDAFNGITLGLRAQKSDSVAIMTDNYRQRIDEILTNIELVNVSPILNGLKNTYEEWLKSIKQFMNTNSSKIIELDNTKRSTLLRNPESDTKYIDKQISDFFEEMDKAQDQWRNMFTMERKRLMELPEPPMEIKK